MSAKTVFVGMSGGVDSSVTAGLLKSRGYNVVGVHLRCWNVDGCAEQDAEDARRAAETLGIPFYVFDFEKEYKDKVVEYMVDGYKKGITPNPDVMCNQEIKFGLFYKRAMELGADFVATGHYIIRRGDKLFAGKDKDKDQSYFLWTLTPAQIKRCLFPIGDLIKRTEVRRLAKKYKLPNAEKKDSQGICFIGAVTLDEFLADFIPARKGAVVTTGGEVVGEHKGAQFYTIGQRKGVGVSGSAEALYVAEKDIKKNMLTVATENDPVMYKKEITLNSVNIISKPKTQNIFVRVRYRQPVFLAKLIGNKIVFNKPQKFIAPGQSAVFYTKSGQMLGGGIINKTK